RRRRHRGPPARGPAPLRQTGRIPETLAGRQTRRRNHRRTEEGAVWRGVVLPTRMNAEKASSSVAITIFRPIRVYLRESAANPFFRKRGVRQVAVRESPAAESVEAVASQQCAEESPGSIEQGARERLGGVSRRKVQQRADRRTARKGAWQGWKGAVRAHRPRGQRRGARQTPPGAR